MRHVKANKSIIMLTYKNVYISEMVEFSMFTKIFFTQYDVLSII